VKKETGQRASDAGPKPTGERGQTPVSTTFYQSGTRASHF